MSIIRFHIPLKWALATLLLMCELSGLTSCRKELCYHHYRAVAVDLEWEQEWERDHGDNHRVNWGSQLTGGEYADLIPGVSDEVTVLIYNLEASSGVVSVAGLTVEDSENVTIGSSFDVTLDPWDEV